MKNYCLYVDLGAPKKFLARAPKFLKTAVHGRASNNNVRSHLNDTSPSKEVWGHRSVLKLFCFF